MSKDVEELLSRGVGEFIDPDGAFRKKLESNPEQVVIKFGVDPTRPDIHLGHAVVLRKLRQFQDLGCKVVFLIGDITAELGDPSGKSKLRPEIMQDEIRRNMQTYLDQVNKILKTDENVFSWITNSDWFVGVTDVAGAKDSKLEIDGKSVNPESFLGKAIIYEKTRRQTTALGKSSVIGFTLLNVLAVLRKITHSRLIARDMFQERLKSGEELYMHEMLYPVLQGIDSLVIARIYGSCDLEIGGTDQTFNMLVGRDVLRMSKLPEQAVMSMKILPGLDGKEKMSKSLDNYIAIADEPGEMYGKVMSVPDMALNNYFELCTYTSTDEIETIVAGHPKEAKMRLAREIVEIYHGREAAGLAEKNFEETFSKGGVPKDIKTVTAEADEPLVEILLREGLVSSKTEFNRLEKAGAIKEIESGVYRIGKHRFLRISRS